MDHKSDEMWCGVVFKDLSRWSSYSREKQQIAYYGGRLSSTRGVLSKLQKELGPGPRDARTEREYRSIDYELQCAQNKEKAMRSTDYLWDMGFGIVQGRGKLLSEVLPWYGTGDIIGVLVDTDEGVVYFFKEQTLVWLVRDAEMKSRHNRCKVFGSTDQANDTLIYQRVLWTQHRERALQRQLATMKKRVHDYENRPEPDESESEEFDLFGGGGLFG